MTNLPSQTNSIFGLLRHGETEWNTKKRIQGFSNSPLTAKGISQTKEWAETLQQWEWDQIYASDLGRVKQTAAILNESLNLPLRGSNHRPFIVSVTSSGIKTGPA